MIRESADTIFRPLADDAFVVLLMFDLCLFPDLVQVLDDPASDN